MGRCSRLQEENASPVKIVCFRLVRDGDCVGGNKSGGNADEGEAGKCDKGKHVLYSVVCVSVAVDCKRMNAAIIGHERRKLETHCFAF